MFFSGVGLGSLVAYAHFPNIVGMLGFFMQVIGALMALVGVAYYRAKYRQASGDRYGI